METLGLASHTHTIFIRILAKKKNDATFRQSIPRIYIKPYPGVYTELAQTTKSSAEKGQETRRDRPYDTRVHRVRNDRLQER